MNFNELDLTKIDKDLTDAERDDWQAIYASYRGRSVISGEVAGVDLHEFDIIPKGKRKPVRKTVRCLIIINYRVKVIIPETGVYRRA